MHSRPVHPHSGRSVCFYLLFRCFNGSFVVAGVLVGCKSDMSDAVVVSADTARSLADDHGLQHFECSAFDGKEVDTPFNYLASVFHRAYEAKVKQFVK